MNIVKLQNEDGPGRGYEPPADPFQFEEAVEAFRARVPMTDDEFDALEELAHQRAFTVAGVTKLDLLTELWQGIDRAVAEGITLAEFKESISRELAASWSGATPARLENIFRTNVQSAYGAGRVKQLRTPAVKRARPYWKFSAIEDARTSAICQPLGGTVLPADDPWWNSHQPPLHFQCRSTILPMTERQAVATGVAEKPPAIEPLPGFGNTQAGEQWKPDPEQYPEPLRPAARRFAA